MIESPPRLRMFAGPNGSGKSTLKPIIPKVWLGSYVNADEIEISIRSKGVIALSEFGINRIECAKIYEDIHSSSRLAKEELARIVNVGCQLRIDRHSNSSYLAAVIAEQVRQSLIHKLQSFTFETVMSHPSKIDLLAQAQKKGFRTYLYFVATEDPEINKRRVSWRVKNLGHSVPEEKIESRYYRSLDLLLDAIRYSDRAFLFDNSRNQQDKVWFAEITNGSDIEYKSDSVPAWFKRYILDKIA